MYITKNLNIPSKNELHLIGASLIDKDRYVCANLKGIYVLTSSELAVLNKADSGTYKYVINMIPYRDSAEVQLHGRVYIGTFAEDPTINVYSNYSKFSSIMGMQLANATNCAQIKISDDKITTNDEIKEYCVFNKNMGIILTNKAVSNGTEFFYLENCMIEQFVDIKYSSIIHPLNLTHLRPLTNYLEIGGNTSMKYKVYTTSGNLSTLTYINLHRLKMLFSLNGSSWYKYNTSSEAFEIVTPAGTYFTFTELCTQGNDYNTYTRIPVSKYISTFGSDISNIHVLSNGWVLPRYIKHSMYNDSLDSSKFIWNNTSIKTKRVVSVGDI